MDTADCWRRCGGSSRWILSGGPGSLGGRADGSRRCAHRAAPRPARPWRHVGGGPPGRRGAAGTGGPTRCRGAAAQAIVPGPVDACQIDVFGLRGLDPVPLGDRRRVLGGAGGGAHSGRRGCGARHRTARLGESHRQGAGPDAACGADRGGQERNEVPAGWFGGAEAVELAAEHLVVRRCQRCG